MVFNRWGDKVFEQENYQNDWKGTHNGQNLPPATYFYIIELGEGNEPVQGYVSIMR
jgi:gliding motility-associated-like protein